MVQLCQMTKMKKLCQKPYKFDHEVKGQCHIRIMNVLNTLSHGDRPMAKHTEVTGHRPAVKSKVLTYNFLANKPIAF